MLTGVKHSVLNVKALVGVFKQEKALVWGLLCDLSEPSFRVLETGVWWSGKATASCFINSVL